MVSISFFHSQSRLFQLLTSPYFIPLFTTPVFILTSLAIQRNVKSSGPYSFARRLQQINNTYYAQFSLVYFLTLFYASVVYPVMYADQFQYGRPVLEPLDASGTPLASGSKRAPDCPSNQTRLSQIWNAVNRSHWAPNPSVDQDLRVIYYVSKVWEYIDIFLVLATGGDVSVHFGWHHLTTPILTYTRTIYSQGGFNYFALLNSLHHYFMYSYFAGSTHFKQVLHWTGWIQLLVGIAVEAKSLASGGGRKNWIALGLLASYAVLFWREEFWLGKVDGSSHEKVD